MWLWLAIGLGGLLVFAKRKRPPSRPREEINRVIEQTVSQNPAIANWFCWAQADKESSFDSSAGNFSGEDSLGLYQINWRAHKSALEELGIARYDLYDPWVNAQYWAKITNQIKGAVKRKGYQESDPMFWYYVRFRLAGIRWEDFGGAYALGVVNRFRPYVERWKARFNG